ncbi:Ribosomal RNA small subunit methyltransferase C [Maioricimonas rarisocia]|uniref:Ribosomal RNA small subunit methyltransferase C n=1 Tax=Maioricimonas rarisocia TaxID=2528026 RepID=A0A517Z3K8_9PLAN|nr:methyltransferase [Maioricimonas rarisocia]QDU37061.1 Ribosomal RNA small subunit methyltransferase C [Maioricimonas rarisocia]
MNGSSDDAMESYSVRVPASEQLLINVVPNLSAPRALCTTIGRAQFAKALAEVHGDSQVQCHFLDLYQAQESREYLDMTGSPVNMVCSPDLPEGEIDLFALPTTRGGEAELTRELLQQGYQRLRDGGTLLAAVDNRKDTWLHHEIEKLTRSITRLPKKRGVLYRATKKGPLKRERDFYAEFAFRDGENLIKAVSRPGVFSHRRLDLGARALMEGMTVQPGDRVLDIGCGAGVVGLAAAMREEGITVHAVDSNIRAVECALLGAELNGVEGMTAQADADGEIAHPGAFDVVVGNPPYFSQYRIAEIFLQGALRALRPGGRVQMVTKHPDWFLARMEQLFNDVTTEEHRGYQVVSAVQRG